MAYKSEKEAKLPLFADGILVYKNIQEINLKATRI